MPGQDGAPDASSSTLPSEPAITPEMWSNTKQEIVQKLRMQVESMDKGLLQAAVISEANNDFQSLSDKGFCEKYAVAATSDQQTWLVLCQNAA